MAQKQEVLSGIGLASDNKLDALCERIVDIDDEIKKLKLEREETDFKARLRCREIDIKLYEYHYGERRFSVELEESEKLKIKEIKKSSTRRRGTR